MGQHVNFYHQHNLVEPETAGAKRRFGIRVSLPAGDTFNSLLGEDWERIHWYATDQDRDRAFDDMAARHAYSRGTDAPTQILEKISR
jgi:hypothetical protein